MTLYRTITADPPWAYRSSNLRALPEKRPNTWNGATGGCSSSERYGSMPLKEICSLKIPSAENAHLYLWTTNAFMVEAHTVAKAWGFKPKTIVTWAKVKADGITPSMKMGHYFRGATEHVLFCVKGSLKLKGKPAPTWFAAPRAEHSRKPQRFYEIVEEQSHLPALELFARPLSPLFMKRDGWDVWGDQVESDVSIATRENYAS